MFRLAIALFLLTYLMTLVLSRPEDPKYESKYDNIDIDQILTNKRLMDNYMKCLVKEGSCTPDGQLLRDTLPDAIENGCSKCTEKQKSGSEKVINFVLENRPEDWKKIEKMYDPERKYVKMYCALEGAKDSKACITLKAIEEE